MHIPSNAMPPSYQPKTTSYKSSPSTYIYTSPPPPLFLPSLPSKPLLPLSHPPPRSSRAILFLFFLIALPLPVEEADPVLDRVDGVADDAEDGEEADDYDGDDEVAFYHCVGRWCAVLCGRFRDGRMGGWLVVWRRLRWWEVDFHSGFETGRGRGF